MFRLLESLGIKPVTWMITGVGVIILLIVIGLYKVHTKDLVANGAITKENAILKQNEDFVGKSNVITDVVVDNFVQSTKESTKLTYKLRHESINGYINKIEPKVESKATTTEGITPDGADRVSLLVDSMHTNYCRARPKDVQCNTVDTVK